MTTTTTTGRRAGKVIFAALRGFLIGLAELIPGVSGGTVALITGVYERVLASASHVLAALRILVTGPQRAAGFRREFKRADWWLILPLLAGMAFAVLSVAGLVAQLVADNPEVSRGLFFGLVAVSIIVPIRLLPRKIHTGSSVVVDVIAVAIPAIVAFFLVGMASGGVQSDPPVWTVFFAAAVAVCALIIPGVSGSFFLLAIGLYAPTLQAVDQRDLGYIGVFAAGALLGLVTIVQVMQWLLTKYRRGTLLVVIGLMIGSLRALWPWQSGADEHGIGALAAPTEPILMPVLFALLGAIAVAAMVIVEARLARRTQVDSFAG